MKPRSPLALPESNPALGKIIGCQLDGDCITGQDTNVVFTYLAGYVRGDHMTVFEFHSEHCIRQCLDDRTLHFNLIFFSHTFEASGKAAYSA